ncbi:MAG: hypothetical protein K6356_06675 [Chloroflexus sp.]
MSLEGLQAVLNKEEIVSTPLAVDLLDQPARIEATFRRHVRTYIPLGRQAAGNEQGPSVAEFERQIIRDVRSGGATRGYLTGEYGYGKTSTALYLWERARAENLLAVPPFKFQSLKDLIIASYGWVRYELERLRPGLLQKAREIYETTLERSAQSFAARYRMQMEDAQRMLQEQPELLRLTTRDYIRFIESLTHLVQEAGFDGLLVLADELQQYIEPAVQAGQRDPISALFDLVEAIRTRRGELPFGLILIIPPKDLGLLRDQRGDLVHRMLQTSLDLNAIYDRWFPKRLWYRLATTFAFEEHRDQIISAECLDALGQIAARGDLSDGPRTVINAFRRAIQRYIQAGYPQDSPYTPETLIEDFLSGAITFDSARRIPYVTGLALEHSMIKGHPLRERAIKWAAAFPQEGLSRALQERLGLAETIAELARSLLNDLLIEVGDRRSGGITLRGLDHVGVQTDWLTTTIREFWRVFDQDQQQSRRWVIAAFLSLLTTRVFPANQWSAPNVSSDSLFSTAGMILEGCFVSMRQRFPNRRIAVSVLWQDEPDPGMPDNAELMVIFRIYNERYAIQGLRGLSIDVAARRIVFNLDLLRRDENVVAPQIDQFVRPAILSTDLTPYLLLSLYQFLEEKRLNNLIPKEDLQFVQYAFQAGLLDSAFQILFHSDLDESRSFGQERLIESALTRLMEQLYPNYSTLIRTGQWNSAIQKYISVLQRRNLTYERPGEPLIEGTKRDIATMFTLSETAFDNFVENFGSLIVIERPFPNRATARAGGKGAVRLILHPLEQEIMTWIRTSLQATFANDAGARRSLPLAEVHRRAMQLGYLPQEINLIVKLLQERQLVEHEPQRDVLVEKTADVPSVAELDSALVAWREGLTILRSVFPASAQIIQWQQEVDTLHRELREQLSHRPNDPRIVAIRNQLRHYRRLLGAFINEQQQRLREKAIQYLLSLPRFDSGLVIKLDTTVYGSTPIAQTLNSLRVEGLRCYKAIDDALNRLRSEIEKVKQALESDALAPGRLAQNAAELTRLEEEMGRVRQQYVRFVSQVGIFTEWLNLEEQASQLSQELQQFDSEADAYRSAFDQWKRDAQSFLANSTFDTISVSTTLQQQLHSLRKTVQQAIAAAVQQFTAQEALYRQVISTELGLNDTTLWSSQQYNPYAITESKNRLVTQVKESLQHWCAQIGKMIRQAQTDIRSTLASSQITALTDNERRHIQEQGNRLETELKTLLLTLVDLEGQTEDPLTLQDLPAQGEGRFHSLVQSLRRVRIRTEQAQQEIAALQQILQALQLTPTEEQLFAVLATGDATVEVASLRALINEISDDEFWRALKGLHAKRRLRVYCERIFDT